MSKVKELIQSIAESRNRYVNLVASVSESLAQTKPSPDVWNVVEITEHLYWAEHGGLMGMWKTLYAIRNGNVERTTESQHKGMTIGQVVDLTWQPTEQVPSVAAPRMGGTRVFWQESLNSLQSILESFGDDIKEDELLLHAHPHPISGPLSFHQRLEFLKFHIDRHYGQVQRLLSAING